MSNRDNNNFDAIIIGAGINGCGIANELSINGKKVLIIDKATIGSGTSSKSSRLIHGGLRYLETFGFGLVHEALHDRQELLRTYPNLVKWRSFYLPVYKTSPRPAWMIWLGLKLYDRLVGKQLDHRSGITRRNEFCRRIPCLTRDGLRAVFHYYDAKTNDLALTQQVARNAQSNGAQIIENLQVRSIEYSNTHFQIKTDTNRYSSPILINATGPWIDEVNEYFKLPARYHIRKISGIHIVIKGLLAHDLLFMQTKGKRIFFIIPEIENDHTLIGTTEREETVPVDQVSVNVEDVRYLIENINNYLAPEYQIDRSKIVDQFIGVRPLIAAKDNPTDLSREYELDLHRLGNCRLLHIFGGKLTTFLSLARKVAAALQE